MSYLSYSESTLRSQDAYWTAKEISQQPRSWQSLIDTLKKDDDNIRQFLNPLLKNPSLRIILTGAGTSAFVGNSLAPAMMKHLNRSVESIATTDLVSNPHEYFHANTPTLLVSFARSGNSPESVAACDYADTIVKNCYQLAITCNNEGALYKSCSGANKLALLMPSETNDKSFAMTSSFSSMLLTGLYAFCHTANFDSAISKVIAATEKLFESHLLFLRNCANKKFERVVFLGSGCLKGIAQESALKLLELTDGKAVAVHDSPLGFRHGPKAIVNDKTLVFVYLSNAAFTRKYDIELLEELQRDNEVGQLISVSAQHANTFKPNESVLINGCEEIDDIFIMLPFIASAQMFALFYSLAVNNTPDNPSASGTINRVVQGVHIHNL